MDHSSAMWDLLAAVAPVPWAVGVGSSVRHLFSLSGTEVCGVVRRILRKGKFSVQSKMNKAVQLCRQTQTKRSLRSPVFVNSWVRSYTFNFT